MAERLERNMSTCEKVDFQWVRNLAAGTRSEYGQSFNETFSMILGEFHQAEKTMKLYYTEMNSPVGRLKLVAHEKCLVAVLWENDSPNRVKLPELEHHPEHPLLLKTIKQLDEYFSGQRKEFQIPLDPIGTAFQKKVWSALRQIPFGKTKSYGELAKDINHPKASRAVGAANGRNPISIIVPCHRVIGANGTLTGFAGGLKAKDYLLKGES